MPAEYLLLRDASPAHEICPEHPSAGNDFLRGMVQSWWRRLLRLPYCAVICCECQEVIAWERPPQAKGEGA